MNQEIFMKFLWSWPECIVIILQNFFLFFIQPIFVKSNEKILIMVSRSFTKSYHVFPEEL